MEGNDPGGEFIQACQWNQEQYDSARRIRETSQVLAGLVPGRLVDLRAVADDEFPRLARIYNLHRHYRDILVNGLALPESAYGPYAVSRGDRATRLVTLRNLTWQPVKHKVKLDETIGLTTRGDVELRQFHPTERWLGRFAFGSEVEVATLPFRACLVMATTKPAGDIGVSGCDYALVRDVPAKPVVLKLSGLPGEAVTVKLLGSGTEFGEATLDGLPVGDLLVGESLRVTFPGQILKQAWHRKLGDLRPVAVPRDAEAIYEATCFAADSNALEVRSLVRSGPTLVPQVQEGSRRVLQPPAVHRERHLGPQPV